MRDDPDRLKSNNQDYRSASQVPTASVFARPRLSWLAKSLPWIFFTRSSLLAQNSERSSLAAKGLQYERLDQLTLDILLGVR